MARSTMSGARITRSRSAASASSLARSRRGCSISPAFALSSWWREKSAPAGEARWLYVSGARGELEDGRLRTALSAVLPDYMVPARSTQCWSGCPRCRARQGGSPRHFAGTRHDPWGCGASRLHARQPRWPLRAIVERTARPAGCRPPTDTLRSTAAIPSSSPR